MNLMEKCISFKAIMLMLYIILNFSDNENDFYRWCVQN